MSIRKRARSPLLSELVAAWSKDLRGLTRHPKKLKGWKSATEELLEVFRATGPTARKEIIDTSFELRDVFPDVITQEWFDGWLNLFLLEEEIEEDDPKSFEDAIARARQDVDLLFGDSLSAEEIKERLLSPLPKPAEDRPSLEELRFQWISRWIAPSKESKRKVNEWGKLIGFVGEYMV